MTDIRATLTPEGDVEIVPTHYLGGQTFARYRQALSAHGARYVPSTKSSRLQILNFGGCLRDLAAAGFVIENSQPLIAKLQQEAAAALRLLEEGNKRLAQSDARLATSGLKPYPFQRTGVQWLAPRRTALLADEMGLGKSIQTAIALPGNAAALIVCPTAMRLVWQHELKIWRDDLRVSQMKEGFRWPRKGEVLITSYGVLARILPKDEAGEYILPVPEDEITLVPDEAHNLRNKNSKRAKAFMAVKSVVMANAGRVWLLTATPLINRPKELWNVLEVADLGREAFGNKSKFLALCEGQKTEATSLAMQRIMLRRKRDDVLPDLPKKRRQDIEIEELHVGTLKACDAIVDALLECGIDINKLPADSDLGTLISGPVFKLMSAARAALATAKIPAMLELVESYEDAEEPLVVFCCHLEPLQALKKREGWALITGDVSAEDRFEIVQRFQRGELKGLGMTYEAGGVGITATRAAYAVCVDLPWTPALVQQAEDRLARITQTRAVLIQRLIADHPLDRRVTEILTEKMRIIERAVEDASVGADARPANQAEQIAQAADQAAKNAADANTLRVSAHEARQEMARKAQEEMKRSWGANWDGREVKLDGKFRGPINAREVCVKDAILTLAANDCDRAREQNQIGFSKLDGQFGHSLAERLRATGVLSELQWKAAERLALRYHRQVGRLFDNQTTGGSK